MPKDGRLENVFSVTSEERIDSRNKLVGLITRKSLGQLIETVSEFLDKKEVMLMS